MFLACLSLPKGYFALIEMSLLSSLSWLPCSEYSKLPRLKLSMKSNFFGRFYVMFLMRGHACLITLRKFGLFLPSFKQSNDNRVFIMLFGIDFYPIIAPIIPPTIQAFVSVSPPSCITYLSES